VAVARFCIALSLLVLSPRLAAQEWALLPSVIPEPRIEHASCVLGRFIYLLGGAAGEDGAAVASNYRYDTVTGAWAERAPMPTARRNAAAAATGGKCYVIGGWDGDGAPTGVVEIYDPSSNSWSAGAGMPTARAGLGAGAIEGLVYAVGGEADGYLTKLEVYDPQADSWASRASMPTARSMSAVAVLDGKLYVAGGTNDALTGFLDVLEAYDPSTNAWSNRKPLPLAVSHLSGAASINRLYLAGGIGEGGTSNKAFIYNPVINFWAARPPLTRVRNRHAMERVGSRLFALGGAEAVSGTPLMVTDTLESLEIGFANGINPGLNDAWVSDEAPFQGLFITVFENLGSVFVAWFTFDSDSTAVGTAVFGAKDQRWVTGLGALEGDTAVISVELTSGGVFNASDPLARQQTAYGTITIVFKSCNEATMAYDFPATGLSGETTIRRAHDANVGLCESAAPKAQADPEPEGLEGITARHNEYRDTVGVPPLAWDPDLAAIAQAWAEACVDEDGSGLIDHNPDRSANYQGSVGENIYGTGARVADPIAAVDLWGDEEADYDIVTNTCSGICGHWTQVVWEDSKLMGCGKHVCPGLNYGRVIVCDYSPAGNIRGQWPYTPVGSQ